LSSEPSKTSNDLWQTAHTDESRPHHPHGVPETRSEPQQRPQGPSRPLCCAIDPRVRDTGVRRGQDPDHNIEEWPDRAFSSSCHWLSSCPPNAMISSGCYPVLPVCADGDSGDVDRCRVAGWNRRDKWHRAFPRTPGLQGTDKHDMAP